MKIYTKNFHRIRNGHVAHAPKRVKNPLTWDMIQKATGSAGVSVAVEKVDGKGLVSLTVGLPSGGEFVRKSFFKSDENFLLSAAKAVRALLLGFEPGRGMSAKFSPLTEAPDIDALADVAATYSALDAAAGALLRSEIAA